MDLKKNSMNSISWYINFNISNSKPLSTYYYQAGTNLLLIVETTTLSLGFLFI